jgi:7-keto-8-aminopelargonate synthetase-like enzyme
MEFVSPTEGPYILWQGKKWLDFSSYDFLGLAQHPEVKKGAIKYTLKYGVGVPIPSLGSIPQQQLESKLAQFLGTEMAILFPSYDEALQTVKNLKATLICSESEEFSSLPKKSPLLCIDDSLTLGTAGEHGFGIAAHKKGIDLITGSLAYGVGCSGAFIAGSKKILTSWVSSQPLSYSQLGALDCALSFILEMNGEREILANHRSWLEKILKDLPAKMMISPRVVINFKSEKEAELARLLFQENQIFLGPPTHSTLCIAVTALHTPDDLDQLAISLKKLSATDWALAMQSLTPGPAK